jgi:hypothetical protein
VLTVDASGIHFMTPNFDANSGNGGVSAAEVSLPEDLKIVTNIYWTYGSDKKPLIDISRYYADLNLHIETLGYKAGETVSLLIETPEGKALNIGAEISDNGTALLEKIFEKDVFTLEGSL